jgi:hypothetical protein
VKEQRRFGKRGKLSKDRVAQLNGIGFTWVVLENPRPWDESFEMLKAYKEEYGHCRVTDSVEFRGVKLGIWVATQRRSHKKGELSEEKVARLNEIGFTWAVRESSSWDEWFELLKVYKEEYGHCRVLWFPEYVSWGQPWTLGVKAARSPQEWQTERRATHSA